MKWSMISQQASTSNPALEWYINFPLMPGVTHTTDDINRVYAHTPPDDLLIGVEEPLLFDDTNPDYDAAILQMIAQAAAFMTAATPNVLTGEPWKFKAMYATPHHRIWCERYDEEDTTAFSDDYLAVFGVVVGTTTQAQASQQIKQYFSGE